MKENRRKSTKPSYLKAVKISISMPALLFDDAQAVQIRLRKPSMSHLIQYALTQTIAANSNPGQSAAPTPSPSI
jgi:hypothetical protein